LGKNTVIIRVKKWLMWKTGLGSESLWVRSWVRKKNAESIFFKTNADSATIFHFLLFFFWNSCIYRFSVQLNGWTNRRWQRRKTWLTEPPSLSTLVRLYNLNQVPNLGTASNFKEPFLILGTPFSYSRYLFVLFVQKLFICQWYIFHHHHYCYENQSYRNTNNHLHFVLSSLWRRKPPYRLLGQFHSLVPKKQVQ